MEKLNEAFAKLAKWLHLPSFFKGETLILNNLFLVLVAVVLLVALLLVIFLMPGKKKKGKKNEKEAEAAEESLAPAEEPEPEPVEESPVIEEAPQEKPIPVVPIFAPKTPAKKAAPVAETPKEPEPKEESVSEEDPVVEEESAPVAEPKASKEVPAPKSEPEPKEEATAAKSSGKYEIVKRNGSFFFLLKANNGQLLLESSAYTTEQGVKKAIETFKNAVEVGEFTIDEDKNGNFKFILRASARSQVRYFGESYGTRQSAENAIGSVKKFAFTAAVRRVESKDEESKAASVATMVETKPLKESDHKLGGKYEIAERNGDFHFLLKANNGQLLLESPAFTSEQGAKSGIETFKKAADSGVYVIDEDKNGNFRFILRATTRSQVRYFGESYGTRQSAENSVASVRAFAQKALLK